MFLKEKVLTWARVHAKLAREQQDLLHNKGQSVEEFRSPGGQRDAKTMRSVHEANQEYSP